MSLVNATNSHMSDVDGCDVTCVIRSNQCTLCVIGVAHLFACAVRCVEVNDECESTTHVSDAVWLMTIENVHNPRCFPLVRHSRGLFEKQTDDN